MNDTVNQVVFQDFSSYFIYQCRNSSLFELAWTPDPDRLDKSQNPNSQVLILLK